MAVPSPLDRSKSLPPPLYYDDVHWQKLKESISMGNEAIALTLLRDYKGKRICDKLDQFLLETVEENQPMKIFFLVNVLDKSSNITELSRVCEAGASILISKASDVPFRFRNPAIPYLARGYGLEYRRWGWLKRAEFMEMIAQQGGK